LRDCFSRTGIEREPTVLPLGIDVEGLRTLAARDEVDARLGALAPLEGQQLIVRSDRIEPAKAIGDGLAAYAQLLEARPDLREHVTHLVRATSSRETVPEYQQERARLDAQVADINERFGSGDWSPVVFVVEDDHDATLAAFRRYDVLLVTSRADGMNLVAREGPLLNERDGVLVLSRGAGAADTYADAGALLVEPGDVDGIARALERALELDGAERRRLAAETRERAPGMPPTRWLAEQRRLASLGRDARLTTPR
jgi:trehalose 6-phosphate synthase